MYTTTHTHENGETFDVVHDEHRVLADCPSCGDRELYIGSYYEEEDGEDVPDGDLRLASLADAQFEGLVLAGYLEDMATCEECGAYVSVAETTRVVSVAAAETILAWIDDGVLLKAAIAVPWPDGWGLHMEDGSDVSLVLESLYLTRDPRLDALLTRCIEYGHGAWTREGPETWDWTPTCDNGCPRMRIAPEHELFEESLAAVCPTPPPLALVTAAYERAQQAPR